MLKNIIKLGSANLVSQLLPFVITPIVTRIYSPDSFGSFSIFISIVALISVIASARYELAIVICAKNQLKDLMVIILALSSVLSFLVFLILVIIFNIYPELYRSSPEIILTPLAILISSLSVSLTYYLTRYESFGLLGKASILRAIVFCSLQLTLFIIISQELSLVLSWVISSAAMVFYLVIKAFPYLKIDFSGHLRFTRVLITAKKFSNFPKFSMPASLVSSCNSQFNVIAIPIFFGREILGFYALVERMLAAPISIIGNAIGQVYFSSISDKNDSEIYLAFTSISKRLFVFSVFLFMCFQYALPTIFTVLFGDSWSYSVVILKIFAFQFCVQLLVSPLLMTLQRYRLNKVELFFQSSVLFCYFICYLFYFFTKPEIETILNLVSKLVAFCYLCVYIYMLAYLKYSAKALHNKKSV